MEYLSYLSGFMLAIAVVSVIVQLVYAYALQCLANKNEMSPVAETLAWIPILNLYPFIVCGGGSFSRFAIGAVAFLVGSIAVGLLGASGETAAVVAVGISLLGALGVLSYIGLIFWRTAERRGLNGFIGLLNFVPVANLFVYPYIAFHDGFVPVNKLGAALGFLLIVGPSAAQYQMFDMANTAMQAEMTEATEGSSPLAALQIATQQAITQSASENVMPMADPTTARAMQIAMRISMLDALDRPDPAEATAVVSQIAEIGQQLDEIASSLPEDRLASLRQALANTQQRLLGDANDTGSRPAVVETVSRPTLPTVPTTRAMAAPTPPAAPALEFASVESPQALPVPDSNLMVCEAGTERKGDPTESVWCQSISDGLKHGWSSSRYPNGQLAVAGQYRGGLRHGVWSRWYDDGQLRVQAQFAAGLQDGRLVAWDRQGNVTATLSYVEGEPSSP